jgi:hypothetical protein
MISGIEKPLLIIESRIYLSINFIIIKIEGIYKIR